MFGFDHASITPASLLITSLPLAKHKDDVMMKTLLAEQKIAFNSKQLYFKHKHKT